MSLKLSGEANAEELATLDRLLGDHPEWNARLEAMGEWWTHAAPGSPRLKKGAMQRHLQRLNQSEHLPSRGPRRRRFFLFALGIAASLAGFSFFAYQWQSTSKKPAPAPVATNSVSTKPGSKSKIQLPDGTQVWLNADSRLVYSESFTGAAREVQLCGEAYFDVVKDHRHPFIIHTNAINVLVLGTTLNVRSYANEKNTEAVLIHGSVEVTLNSDPAKKILMKPNDKLVVKNDSRPRLSTPGKPVSSTTEAPRVSLLKAHYKDKDSIATEVLWVKNKLAFDKESLESVALKMERWFNVKVNITEDALKQTEYSGVFEEEALPQVMEALRLTGTFHYSIRRRVVTIRP
ncbi:FecR family protein [Puia sp.]|uniref:FecR family protein n=1 Tax=Puia sp. TaxID=2045100 RepID=UPI002F3FE2D5